MFEHREEGDNHNAEPFAQCYKRMAEIIPNLINEGCNPRIMLDYSGTLLWGFSQMGRQDILTALKKLACDPTLYTHVEWLGSFWSHAVAPSMPIPHPFLARRPFWLEQLVRQIHASEITASVESQQHKVAIALPVLPINTAYLQAREKALPHIELPQQKLAIPIALALGAFQQIQQGRPNREFLVANDR